MHWLIIGAGYVGTALAHELKKRGHSFTGVSRSDDSSLKWKILGFNFKQMDASRPDVADLMSPAPDVILYCVAAGRGGGVDGYRKTYLSGFNNIVQECKRQNISPHFIFISSTSVYPQTSGEWVTECDVPSIVPDMARVLLDAEEACLGTGNGTVLRLAGIYGPGRGVLFEKFMNGSATIDNPNRFLNHIHRDDIVQGILQVAESAVSKNKVFNLVDNEPVQLLEFYKWIALRTNLPIPASGETSTSRFGRTNKRVTNEVLLKLTGMHLKFPTFREGFESLGF
ncbi:MAG: SDR family oxidoreductase [Verrucomicrobiota bacterium]|nr:SDR family oxidoreductase [Verrucomicrobiota bacterium]